MSRLPIMIGFPSIRSLWFVIEPESLARHRECEARISGPEGLNSEDLIPQSMFISISLADLSKHRNGNPPSYSSRTDFLVDVRPNELFDSTCGTGTTNAPGATI
jgi:hypothetical protein